MDPEARQVELGLMAMAVTPSRWWRRILGALDGRRGSWMEIEGSEEEAVTRWCACWSHTTEQKEPPPRPLLEEAALWASLSFTDRTFMAALEMGLASLGLVGGWEFVDLIFGVGVLWGCVRGFGGKWVGFWFWISREGFWAKGREGNYQRGYRVKRYFTLGTIGGSTSLNQAHLE